MSQLRHPEGETPGLKIAWIIAGIGLLVVLALVGLVLLLGGNP